MRDLKFRQRIAATEKNEAYWRYWGYLVPNGDLILPLQREEWDPRESQQFTGVYDNTEWNDLSRKERSELKRRGWDKSTWQGREIYEGDLIISPGRNDGKPHPVVFEKGMFVGKYGGVIPTSYNLFMERETNAVKVVGNIYDDPELLEEEEEEEEEE